ncbi:MAG: YihY/virulence factor BrkB family protein [Bacteroidota bacterium]
MNKLSTLKTFILEVYHVWVSERPNQLAAALAYFGIFSFAPVIYIAYRVASLFINEVAAGERFYTRLEAVLGPETAAYIKESVAAISSASTGGSWIISLISLGTLLFAAMGLFLQIKYALNRVWGIPPTPPGDRFAFLRQQLFAFIILMALGLLVILATLVNLVFAWFRTIVQYYIGQGNLVTVFNMLALFGLVILAFAFVYKVLPDLKVTWRDVWPGSIIATLLTALGGLLIGLYFSLGGVHSAFEAAGAFAVLMIAIYFFAQIFLLGAVITRIYAHQRGSMHKV